MTHPVNRGQLWVVHPDVAGDPAGSGIAGLNRRLAVHRRNRVFHVIGGFVAGAIVGSGAAWLASYNVLGFIVLALAGGVIVSVFAVPRLFPAPAAVTADFDGKRIAPLGPLGVYGIRVDDSTSWTTLWTLASNFAELFEAESSLEAALERADDEPLSQEDLSAWESRIGDLRTRALDSAASVWVPVGTPHPFGKSLTDRV